MTQTVTQGVATITLPPWLDDASMAALSQDLMQALNDPEISGVVLAGGARAFCLGLRVEASQTDAARDLARRIRAARKPVIAAIGGAAVGAGLELALAARLRVADPAARLSLPQIKHGLPPSALGTQTLPSLVGAAAALDLVLGGATVHAGSAPDALIDLIDTAPTEAAHALAAAGTDAPDRIGMADPAAYLAAIERARADTSILAVRARVIDCIEAALILPGPAAEAMETQADLDARADPVSRALRRVSRDEMANGERHGDARLPARIGIIGGTTVAGHMAAAALRAGASVDLVALDETGLAHAAGVVIDRIETAARAGAILPDAVDSLLAAFRPGTDMEPLRQTRLVIEAATGDATLRAELAGAIALFTEPGAAICLGGPGTDPAASVPPTRAGDALGLHLPSETEDLAEIAVTDGTTPDARGAVVAMVRALGRRPIITGVAPGRVVARLAEVSLATAEEMIVEGADPAAIDPALRARFGIARGPLTRAETRGLAATVARRAVFGWGQGGLIDIAHRAGLTDLGDAAAVAAELRAASDLSARDWTARAITDRWLAELAAEAARLLADGTAKMAGDLNIASLGALGLPRLSGGVLFQADLAGLLGLQNTLRDAGKTPPKQLERMVRNGQTFGAL